MLNNQRVNMLKWFGDVWRFKKKRLSSSNTHGVILWQLFDPRISTDGQGCGLSKIVGSDYPPVISSIACWNIPIYKISGEQKSPCLMTPRCRGSTSKSRANAPRGTSQLWRWFSSPQIPIGFVCGAVLDAEPIVLTFQSSLNIGRSSPK